MFRRIACRAQRLQSVEDLFRVSPPLRFEDSGSIPVEPPEEFQELGVAIRDERPIRITYDGGTRGTLRRQVTPLGLMQSGRRVYLIAFCHLDRMEKTFRLDRVREFQIEEEQ